MKPVFALGLSQICFAAACASAPVESFQLLVPTTHDAHRVVADDTRIAFVTGSQAGADSEDGVEIHVVDRMGARLFRATAFHDARDIALLDDAIAAIEFTDTGVKEVVVRPLDGRDATIVAHEHPPLSLTTHANKLYWVEASIQVPEGAHTQFQVELVEADSRGGAQVRTVFEVNGGTVAPVSLLQATPQGFGLQVDSESAWFGWRSLLCNGRSEIFHLDRATRTAARIWRGEQAMVTQTDGEETCECNDLPNNVTDFGYGFAVVADNPIVAGGAFECASTSASSGFVVRAGTAPVRMDWEVRLIAGATSDTAFFVSADRLHRMTTTSESLESDAALPGHADGLAATEREIFVTNRDGIWRHTL